VTEIAIIGCGNVGANSAFYIAERNIAGVVMFDIQPGLAMGKALDMMEAAPIRGYQHPIRATDSMEEVLAAAVIIVAAGSVRAPGMHREDLYGRNAGLIDTLAGDLRGYPGVVILATEPVDLMTLRLVERAGLAGPRVLGLGGILDADRLRALLGRELGITTENVAATVIGRHSEQMIPLADYCRVSGVPVRALMDAGRFDALADETRRAGDVIVEMAQRASSYYGPSAAAADLAQAVMWDTRRILSVSTLWSGQYGISGVAMSLPAVVGAGGAERVLEPRLGPEQIETMQRSARELRQIHSGGAG